MFYVVLHAPLGTLVFSVFFLHIPFAAVLHGPLDTLTFPVFLYILFDALLHAPLDTLAFSVFLYIIFDAVLHAPLDTLAFPCFCTNCLIQCYMHSWTHWCFQSFIHIALSIVTCTVGHTVDFSVLFTLFQAVLHAPLDTIVFTFFCTFCFMQNYMHR